MKQGEIWELYLDPIKGNEQGGRRPGLIISGNLLNEYLGVVIVLPLTTKIKNYKGNVVLEPDVKNGLAGSSEVLLFHIRSVSKDRLKKKLGIVEEPVIKELITNLNDILRY